MFPIPNPKFTGTPRQLPNIPKGRLCDVIGRPSSTLAPRTAHQIFIDDRDAAARRQKLSKASI